MTDNSCVILGVSRSLALTLHSFPRFFLGVIMLTCQDFCMTPVDLAWVVCPNMPDHIVLCRSHSCSIPSRAFFFFFFPWGNYANMPRFLYDTRRLSLGCLPEHARTCCPLSLTFTFYSFPRFFLGSRLSPDVHYT